MIPQNLEELTQCLTDWRAELAKPDQPKKDIDYGVSIANTVDRFIAALRNNDLRAAREEWEIYAYQRTDTYLAPTSASRAVADAVGRIIRELQYLR